MGRTRAAVTHASQGRERLLQMISTVKASPTEQNHKSLAVFLRKEHMHEDPWVPQFRCEYLNCKCSELRPMHGELARTHTFDVVTLRLVMNRAMVMHRVQLARHIFLLDRVGDPIDSMISYALDKSSVHKVCLLGDASSISIPARVVYYAKIKWADTDSDVNTDHCFQAQLLWLGVEWIGLRDAPLDTKGYLLVSYKHHTCAGAKLDASGLL